MKLTSSALILLGLCGVCIGAGGGGVSSSSSSSSVGSLAETDMTRILKKNNPLMLTCSPNMTNVQTKWTKGGEEVVQSDHIQLFPNTTLYIAKAVKEDVGEYTCEHVSMVEPKVIHVVELYLHKLLPKSTTVLANTKLSITCEVDGSPTPKVQWLRDGEPVNEEYNSTRVMLSENEAGVSNATLRIDPVYKSDRGSYLCLISQYSIQYNTTTEVRVKDIYAALWPFLGIVAEVVLVCIVIYIHERRQIRKKLEMPENDRIDEQKMKEENKENDVRQRKS